MEPIFRQNFTVDNLSVDCFGKLKPSMLLYYVQEAACNHFATLEDAESPMRENIFWAVTRHRVQVSRMPALGETITVETWPMPTTRVAYPRAFVFYDSQGNAIVRAISLWVLMDAQSRSLVLPGKSGVTVNGILRGTELEMPKSLLPKDLSQSTSRTVTYSLLDANRHMNNTRYLDWVDDLLGSEYHAAHTLQEFTICYLSEALEGQNICIHHDVNEDILQVDARRERTNVDSKVDRVFSAEVHFR